MPLLDHFHPPLLGLRHWESFHALWAGGLVERLNTTLLPTDYFAEIQVHVGGRIEVDVGTFHHESATPAEEAPEESSSAVATLAAPPKVWTPPIPTMRFPAVFPDVIELLVFSSEAGPTLVAAVEFVSPGNKDRPETRRAFAAKCASYLQDGIGLAIIDIVSNRRANLHNELMGLLDQDERSRMTEDPFLYATAYQPVRTRTEDAVATWLFGLGLGESLPTVPLALRGGPCLPLELEDTYAEVCRRARLV